MERSEHTEPDRSAVLVVDDEENVRHMLDVLLTGEGRQVITAASGEQALELLDEHPIELILCDLRMPGMGGRELVGELEKRVDAPTLILMSAYGDRDTALDVIRDGAYDFIAKPFDPDDLLLTLAKAEERERLRHENRALRERLDEPPTATGIVAASEAIRRVLSTTEKVARHKTTVLVTGESGTGKELIARRLHDCSERSEGPFIPVNCGAIPSALLESELFGHVKGAFTGAHKDRPGLVTEADGGTLFLDEIAELPMELQVKLLRTLQEGTVRAVGGDREQKVDVRIIAATSRDLAAMIDSGEFRSDLYYRINVVTLHIPPLRDRSEDILPLARHFLLSHSTRLGMAGYRFLPATMRRLLAYTWPGNVRELENAVERALVLAGSRDIAPADLPPRVLGDDIDAEDDVVDADDMQLKPAIKALESRYIRAALESSHGNRTAAARRLGISLRALHYKLREYGLEEVGK